jgi:hypothetical protein
MAMRDADNLRALSGVWPQPSRIRVTAQSVPRHAATSRETVDAVTQLGLTTRTHRHHRY